MIRRITALTLIVVLAVTARAQVSFSFDYTYDGGFFTATNAGRQTALVAAGNYVANIINSTALAAITPNVDVSNEWYPTPFNPSNTSSNLSLSNPTVAANTIIVYVGGSSLGTGVLGVGGPSSYTGGGSAAFTSNLSSRGVGSYVMTGIGSMSFSNTTSWYFDNDPNTVESFAGEIDFFSVAVHELFHVLGFGTNTIWSGLTNTSAHTFSGTASETAYGGVVPLNSGNDHWAEGTSSTVYGSITAQETAMDPSISYNQRKYATALDTAALSDLGYTVTAVPEPSTVAGVIGLIALGWAMQRRRRWAG